MSGAQVRIAEVPHVGPTLGFRLEIDGRHGRLRQRPPTAGSRAAPRSIRRCSTLCEGADLLIHDAQFDDLEFSMRSDWGHCTVDYAVEVAAQAGVGTLALFHHDPSHSDTHIDELRDASRREGRAPGCHRGR